MLEFYKTFHQPLWTVLLMLALYFPIKKILYQLYMRKFFKDHPEKKELNQEEDLRLSKRARLTSVLLSLVFSYLYVQNVFL
jgi:hypothetical protein